MTRLFRVLTHKITLLTRNKQTKHREKLPSVITSEVENLTPHPHTILYSNKYLHLSLFPLPHTNPLLSPSLPTMSYYNQQQPPVGVPPPQGYPPPGESYGKDAYPPAGYPPQGYPPQAYPAQGYPPPYAPPQYAQPPPQQQSSSGPGCLEGCLAALCCCCLLDACF